MLGYEWENKKKSEIAANEWEREIKIKHKRHFFGLLLFERTQKSVLSLSNVDVVFIQFLIV